MILERSQCQIESLQSELRQREQTVYELVQHSQELAARLNDRTAETARLNRKVVSLTAAHTELKGRFIEALKKLKAARGIVRQAVELASQFGTTLQATLEGLSAGRNLDLSRVTAHAKRLRAQDLRFAVGVHDCAEIGIMVESLQLIDTEKMAALYKDLASHSVGSTVKAEGHSQETEREFRSMRSIGRLNLNTSSADVSLMRHADIKADDMGAQRQRDSHSPRMRAYNGVLSDSEHDISSVVKKSRPVKADIGTRDQLSVEEARPDTTDQHMDAEPLCKNAPNTNPMTLLKQAVSSHTMSFRFVGWDSALTYSFVNGHLF